MEAKLSRVPKLALSLAVYTALIGAAVLFCLMSESDSSHRLYEVLDLDDLAWTLPVTGLLSSVLAIWALFTRRGSSKLSWLALALGLPGLAAFVILMMFVGAAAGVLDQL